MTTLTLGSQGLRRVACRAYIVRRYQAVYSKYGRRGWCGNRRLADERYWYALGICEKWSKP